VKTVAEITALLQETYPHARHKEWEGEEHYVPASYLWERHQAFEEHEKGELVNEVQCLFDKNAGHLAAYINGNVKFTSHDSLVLDGFIVVKPGVFGTESCIYRAID
jgi:hypothetical protein